MLASSDRLISTSEMLEALAAGGRAVAELNAQGKPARVCVVPDGLWIEGRQKGALIHGRELRTMAPYQLAQRIREIASSF
ncbi:hypothetical protein [Methylobacterium nodulans]|uniref:Uncharacterized protein n=1 Tax=Methylobacterium nodulans (strain LMG 21967 / CNCM I-2342 / ORS 2060) TaxID=460265 RepID=B8IIH8_METNO|nr:hypothetical protein [Methylobacterium nodulans]ACL59855.1 hypothetical protein Mnod_5001 [Methylobacterium nodulans ORS 2060]